MATVHSLLDKHCWDVNEMKLLLENDNSSINTLNSMRFFPLHRVLSDLRCSIDIIKCLLQYGADPNAEGPGRESNRPLFSAINYELDIEIIKSLIDAGAQVRGIYDQDGHSPLCLALRSNFDKNVLKMLMDAGCCPRKRPSHKAALHCSLSDPCTKLRADICELLLKEDASFLFEDTGEKCSIMCIALSHDHEPEAIKMFLETGCSLNACEEHYNALGCSVFTRGILRKDTVQLLLDAGVEAKYVMKDEIFDNILIHGMLRGPNCELDAIKLLFDCSTIFHDGWPRYGLIQEAVVNLHCKPEVLQFLIDQGGNAAELDVTGRTPLHFAVDNDNCQPAVIEFLLKNGCPANRRYGMGQYTALNLALNTPKNPEVIEELLKGGSRLAAAGNPLDILKKALEKYNSAPSEYTNYVKTLLKYAFLENLKFNMKDLGLGREECCTVSKFRDECMREIKILKSKNIFQFIGRHSDYTPKAKGNQLLKVLSVNPISVYFDVVSNAYGRMAMEMRVEVQPIYCMSNSSRKVFLKLDIVRKIAGLLEDKDLFSLLVAFFNPANSSRNGEKKPDGKRSSEEPVKLRKRTRRCR